MLNRIFPSRRLKDISYQNMLVNTKHLIKDSMNRFIFETGTPIVSEVPKSIPEWVCKVAGILMAAVVFLLLFICDYRESFLDERVAPPRNDKNQSPAKEDSNVFIGGIPVYDMPQV